MRELKEFTCPQCMNKLVWSSDHNMEMDYEGCEGIISYYYCSECDDIEIEVRKFFEE